MADATAARAQREDPLAVPADAAVRTVARAAPALSRPLVVLWAGIVLATAGFLFLGSLRIGAGNWIGRRMPVREIWSRFLAYLADQGASAALVIVVTAAVVALIAAGVGLWLALGLRDAQSRPQVDESAGM